MQPYAIVIDEEDHGASFDPRLPEHDLNSCLVRGESHRNLIKRLNSFENPEQVFDPALIENHAVVLTEYDSEEDPAEEA